MAMRGYCGIVLLLIAGCGGPNAPGEVADRQTVMSEPSANEDPVDSAANSAIDTRPMAFEDILQKLQEAAKDRRFEQAVKLAEQGLELQPDNLELLANATSLSQSAAIQMDMESGDRRAANEFFFKAASFVRRLSKLQEELGGAVPTSILTTALYNEACAYATNGNIEMALASLQEASESGFLDLTQLETDSDLKSLHDHPEYARLIDKVLENKKTLSAKVLRENLNNNVAFEFDFDLISVDGDRIAMADYKGKVLIVDFWGTWCPPCRIEIPHFVRLHSKYKDAGLEIVGITYEKSDDPIETIRAFAKKVRIVYPCVIGDDATKALVPNFEEFPTTLFVDPNGKVRQITVGYQTYDRLEAIVRALLDEGNSGG